MRNMSSFRNYKIIMIKLIVCFTIVNLAFADAFYGFIKQYEYPDSDLIISDEPYGFNKLAYAVCKGSDPERKCNIYQELIQDEFNNAVWSCDLKLNFTHNVNIQNLDQTHVIVTAKDARKVTLITLNMGMCSVKETTIEADEDKSVKIVPKGDNYDVIFENHKLCGDFFCKVSYDFDGMIVNEATPFGFKVANIDNLSVSKTDKGYLLGETSNEDYQMKVYFAGDNDLKRTLLYTSTPLSGSSFYSSSSTENKFSFCVPVYQPHLLGSKIICQQFDAEGKTKILEVESSTLRMADWDATGVLNLEKGLFVLLRQAGKWGLQMSPSIYVYDEQGKLTMSFHDVDLPCRGGLSTPKVFQNLAGDACITSICRDNSLQNKFSRTYKCLQLE